LFRARFAFDPINMRKVASSTAPPKSTYANCCSWDRRASIHASHRDRKLVAEPQPLAHRADGGRDRTQSPHEDGAMTRRFTIVQLPSINCYQIFDEGVNS
jgi:hypothetical protein